MYSLCTGADTTPKAPRVVAMIVSLGPSKFIVNLTRTEHFVVIDVIDRAHVAPNIHMHTSE